MSNLNWKRILLVIGFVAITIAIGVLLYIFFFHTTPVTQTETTEPGNASDLPIAGPGTIDSKNEVTTEPQTLPTGPKIFVRPPSTAVEGVTDTALGGITAVTDLDYEATQSIELNAAGQDILSYNQYTGTFNVIDDNGNKVQLTDRTFPGAESIAWAPASSKAIIEFPDGANILYDFNSDQQVTLPKTWTDFQFDKNEDKIAFKDLSANEDQRFLGTANPDGSNQKYLEFLGNQQNRVNVQWSPNNQIVANVTDSGGNGTYSKVLFVGQNDENFRSLDARGFNFESTYTPNGDRLVYSAQNQLTDNKPQLYIVDAAGDNIGANHRDLGLKTWSNKCTFQGDTSMICAVPREMPDGAGWFPELADDIPDDLYQVNLQTGQTSFLAQPEVDYTIDQIKVNSGGDTLFFTDKQTQTLHQIKLR